MSRMEVAARINVSVLRDAAPLSSPVQGRTYYFMLSNRTSSLFADSRRQRRNEFYGHTPSDGRYD